ncbi:hypothetical protein BX666DRAFT_1949194 [Dichotomocladium elegans]|nr:hypothetical protein BX666DRAFT_1949194 [Dichotomocladium elegans]
MTTSMYQAFTAHVNASIAQRPLRAKYIQTMKGQLKRLADLKEQQDRSRRLHRKNMRSVGQLYIQTRTHEIPEAQEVYYQKWHEIEKIQNIIMTPTTPTTPPLMRSSTSTTLMTPISATSPMTFSLSASTRYGSADTHSVDEPIPCSPMSFSSAMSSTQPLDLQPTPVTPSVSSPRRIERFMKQFNMGSHHADPARQNARMAKLKVEVVDADKDYRKAVRKLDNLNKRHAAANEYAIKTMQNQIAEKAQIVKEVLDLILEEEGARWTSAHRSLVHTRNVVSAINPDQDMGLYSIAVDPRRYPMPPPVYYRNYHAGECQYLLFGTSLVDYAHQYKRSPPLLVVKCIESIERQGGFEREGIYRISGKERNITKLKHCFERDEPGVVLGHNDVPDDVFSLASLIKIFLRELDSPLFPFKLSDRIAYSQIPDKELRLMNLLTRIVKLPPANYDTLKILIDHLAKLVSRAEKNKMNVQNISLIFTPAIFQDHNNAQKSPGEWFSDCVIEDLIVNSATLFADKDLHSASAITGGIEYGFDHLYGGDTNGDIEEDHFSDFDLPSTPSTTTFDEPEDHISMLREERPDSSNDELCRPDENGDQEDQQVEDQAFTTATQAALSANQDQPRFRAVSQDRKLKVDTRLSTEIHQIPQDTQPVIPPPPPPAIKSATVPPAGSFNWLSEDPSNNEPLPAPLQRSASVGATLKRSSAKSQRRTTRTTVKPRAPVSNPPLIPQQN